ncbi:MAG TPA: hypothetical protein VFS00_10785, partial [Polyangiaceae bacterium]|nr:hypothetical protein [Polyangiaceae bacterium]
MRRAASDRAPPLVWAFFLAATAVFVPLALSAWRFLNLPPVASALGPLGWPAGALRTAHSILLEPDARHGWLVTRPPSSAPLACRFELASLRPAGCHELELRPGDAKRSMHHAFGEGALLLLADEGAGPPGLALRATLLRPGERPIVGERWADPGSGAPGGPASLVNVAWNAHARRFEAYLTRRPGESRGQGESQAKGESQGEGQGKGESQGKGENQGKGESQGEGERQGKGEGKGRSKEGARGELFVLPFDRAGSALAPEPIALVGARPPPESEP